MSFQTVSAILRGNWLLDPRYAQSMYPIVARYLKGEVVDFGFKGGKKMYHDDDDDYTPPPPVLRLNVAGRPVYSVQQYTKLDQLPSGSIAVVNISGPMMKEGDMCNWGMVDHAALINRVAMASNVAGIIIDLDSPGGQAAGTAMLADTILRARQRKPVLGIIDDGMAASAGYWIISATQEIYVTQPTTETGSVGVYTQVADWVSYYRDEHHLPVTEIYAPQSTDKNLDYREAIKGNEDLVKEDLRVLADQFIKTVRNNRKGKLTSDEWTTGKMFYASQAKKIGLIDGVKSFEQVVNRINTLIAG